jgi:1,4-alpha-glucan branching enzyme
MFTHPGKKLLFMGGEFAQEYEWNHNSSLDWHLLDNVQHSGIQTLVRDLNRLYRDVTPLHDRDTQPEGFSWVDCHDRQRSILAFRRNSVNGDDDIFVVCNFTPMIRKDYRLGVPRPGRYGEIFNSDSSYYGGSNVGNVGDMPADDVPMHGQPYSLSLTLPPLAIIVLRSSGS